MPAIRDWSYNYISSSGTSIGCPMPQYEAGDLLIAILSADTGLQTWTPPAGDGWTVLFTRTYANTNTNVNLAVAYKVCGASESDPKTFTFSTSETANIMLISIRDIDTSSPIANWEWIDLNVSRGAMPTDTVTRANSLILYCSAHPSTAVCPSIIEGPVTQICAKDGSAHSDSVAWTFQVATGTSPNNVYLTVTGTTYAMVTAVIIINPPSAGATVIPIYCSLDLSVYVDPLHGTSAFKGNTAFAATALTYFGTRLKLKTLANTTVSAKTDYGINTFRSCGSNTGPTTADTWQGATTVLLDANKPNISGKNVLVHVMPLIPADLQTVYNVSFEKGVAVGMWSADIAINIAKSFNAITGVFTDETSDINNSTANDVALPPIQITTLGDAIYIGRDEIFDGIKLTVGTASSKTGGTLQWQYWNGSAWTPFTPIIDPSAFCQTAGTHFIMFYASALTNWAKCQVPAGSDNKYWIRCVVTVLPTALTTAPLGTQGWHANFKVWNVHGFGTPWDIKRVPAIIHPDNTSFIDKQGFFDKTSVKGFGFFTCGFLTSSDWVWTMIWVLDTTVINGGNASEPIDITGIRIAVADGHERMSIIQQGKNQMLVLQPIQIGDGGTNPTYLDLNATAIEFPSLYNKITKQVYYCSVENIAGITYYAGANDTIKHRNSVVSSPSKYHWRFNVSCSGSAVYDFSGLILINAGDIVICANVNLISVTFNNCSKITAVGNILDDCVFYQSSDQTALEVSNPNQITDKIVNSYFLNNNRAIKITASGTYEFDNLYFSGNTYDIENASTGLVTINCINGANPSTYINTNGGTTQINNVKILTLTGLIAGSEIEILQHGTQNELAHEETSGTSYEYQYNYASNTYVDIIIHKTDYEWYFIENYLLPNANANIPVSQRKDRVYSNI